MKTLARHLLATAALGLALCGASAWAQNETPSAPPGGGRPGGPGSGPGGNGPRWMIQLDLNHDGALSEDEIAGASAALRKLDANADGKVSRDELRGGGGPGPNAGGPRDGQGDGPRRRERAGRPDGDRAERGPQAVGGDDQPRDAAPPKPRVEERPRNPERRERADRPVERLQDRPGRRWADAQGPVGPRGPRFGQEGMPPWRRMMAARALRGMGPGFQGGPGPQMDRPGRGPENCPCCAAHGQGPRPELNRGPQHRRPDDVRDQRDDRRPEHRRERIREHRRND